MNLSPRRRRRALLLLGGAISAAASVSLAVAVIPPPLELPPLPVPAENPITEAKRVLGKTLFWDAQLSSDNTVACGSCHMPSAGLADPAPAPHPGADGRFGTADDGNGSPGIIRQARGGGFVADLLYGYERQVTARSAQGIGMSMFGGDLFWDGRASTTFRDPETGEVVIAEGGGLESHVLAPPTNDVEMAHEDRDWPEIARRLAGQRPLAVATDLPPDVAAVLEPDMRYPALFEAAFGDPAVTPVRIAMAIATYERTLVPDQSPFDTGTMTVRQEQGWGFFNHARTRCTECHVPPQFTNHEFRTLGVRPPAEDPGRQAITGDPADAGAFKVPTLRNVGLKRSFMRDGRFTSLEEVLRFYHAPSRLQFAENIDPELPRIRIPGAWRPFIIEFLAEALTDPRAAAETFPFDRPTLHSELPPNPAVVAEATAIAGTGGHVPRMIAVAPPNLGNDGFALGVAGGLGGAEASLLLAATPPGPDGRLRPDRVLGPFVLSGRGPGGGRRHLGVADPGRSRAARRSAVRAVGDPRCAGAGRAGPVRGGGGPVLPGRSAGGRDGPVRPRGGDHRRLTVATPGMGDVSFHCRWGPARVGGLPQSGPPAGPVSVPPTDPHPCPRHPLVLRAPRSAARRAGVAATGALVATVLLPGVVPASAADGAATDEVTLLDGRAVRTWMDVDPIGAREHYAVQRADGTWTAARELDPTVHLRWGAVDPLAAAAAGDGAAPEVPAALAAVEDGRLHIVQFATQWVEGYRAELEALGAEVHQHLPATARIVRMDAAVAADVAELPFVRWVGPYHPAHRVDERLLAEFDGAAFRLPPQRYVVRLIDPAADRPAFAAAVAAVGGVVDRLDAGSLISEVTLDAAQLAAILARDEVLFVDPWGAYETDMDVAREIGGAVELEAVAGYDGTGVRGEVMDNGFNLGHVDFASRPLIVHGSTDSQSHGASTSGIVFGDGTGDETARGLLHGGQGIVADYGSVGVSGPSRYEHTGELVTAEYEAVLQSCSFGSPRTTTYTNVSAEIDAMIFDFDLSIAQSQSNSGSQLSRPQAWAKNVISVGGVQHQGTLSKTDDRWGGASIGPAADGRIKPDLTHFYDDIRTTTCCGSNAYTNTFGGTSGATPIVAGYLGLFYDMWADGIFGNEVVPGGDVFLNRSAQSTAKAALVNTAVPYDWNVSGPNDNITRVRQGWGMPSIIALHEQREATLVVDESEVIPNLGMWSSTVTVLPDTPMLRITLTWADLPGTTSSSVHRINDLDLTVTAPDGSIYRGNVGLLEDIWSQPGGFRDEVNTVENVFIPQPDAGTWTIKVDATELNEDGHIETPELDTDFALVATGGVPVPPTLIVQLAEAVPALVPPGETSSVTVRLDDGLETLDPATAVLRWRAEGTLPFNDVPLVPVDGEPALYRAEFPDVGCESVEFLVAATSVEGTTVTQPSNAPVVLFGFDVGTVETVESDDFEADAGWTVAGGDATAGQWVRGVPLSGSIPSSDGDGSGTCWQTGLANGDDLDGGSTVLLSPVYALSEVDAITIRFQRYFVTFGDGPDSLVTDVTTDGGATWVEVDAVTTLASPWMPVEFQLAVAGGGTDAVQLRFTATDGGPDSGVEAAIDGIEIIGAVCGGEPADVDGSGSVDFADVLAVLSAWGPCDEACPADVDGDGSVGFSDVLAVLAAWS